MFRPPRKPALGDLEEESCWGVCAQRKTFCGNLLLGVLFLGALVGVAAFVVALVGWNRALDPSEQRVYGVSHDMVSDRLNHVLRSNAPVTLTLPNDLGAFVGRHYTVDCDSPHPHQVFLTPGPLPTFWAGAQRTATCAGQGAGFSFRVLSASRVRVTASTGVTFSA